MRKTSRASILICIAIVENPVVHGVQSLGCDSHGNCMTAALGSFDSVAQDNSRRESIHQTGETSLPLPPTLGHGPAASAAQRKMEDGLQNSAAVFDPLTTFSNEKITQTEEAERKTRPVTATVAIENKPSETSDPHADWEAQLESERRERHRVEEDLALARAENERLKSEASAPKSLEAVAAEDEEEDTPTGGRRSGPTAEQCNAISDELEYIGGSLNPWQCRKERFCCDSWMIEFNREMKAQTNTGHLQRRDIKFDIRVMLWKWIIRKDKDKGEPTHNPMMRYSGGQIGIDSHYFTIVNYCPGKYRIFDTITKGPGRDVSKAFDEDGKIIKKNVITDRFSFEYSDTLDGEAKECAFEDCVVDKCRSRWIKVKRLKASSAKSVTGARCFLGITF